MSYLTGNPGKLHELARYEVRPEALDDVLRAIHEFVAYVREQEPGALRYEAGRVHPLPAGRRQRSFPAGLRGSSWPSSK